MRRNTDAELRGAERSVAGGEATVAGISGLILARVRAGRVKPSMARWAELLSRPFTPPPVSRESVRRHAYNWQPLPWWFETPADVPNAAQAIAVATECLESGRFAQDRRTLVIHDALQALGLVRRQYAQPDHRWLERRDCGLFDTGGDWYHPPTELQWSADFDDEASESLGESTAALAAMGSHGPQSQASMSAHFGAHFVELARQERLRKQRLYVEAAPDGLTDAAISATDLTDPAVMWELRETAIQGTGNDRAAALGVLGWLRRNSTLEYIGVLSPWTTYPLWRHDSPNPFALPDGAVYVSFAEREHELVSSLLGGSPL